MSLSMTDTEWDGWDRPAGDAGRRAREEGFGLAPAQAGEAMNQTGERHQKRKGCLHQNRGGCTKTPSANRS